MNYTPISLKDQAEIIKKHFGVTIPIPKKLPTVTAPAEHLFLIPKWTKLGKTYNKAVIKVLDVLKDTRPCHDWRDGKWGKEYLTRLHVAGVPEILPAQFGKYHTGKHVETVRAQKTHNEILLGVYEVGIMLLTHPDRLIKYEDIWIDCPADKYTDGDFDGAPYFYFRGGRLGFDANYVDYADGDMGSASGWTLTKDRGIIEPCPTKTNPQEFVISTKELKQGAKIKITTVTEITVVEE